MRLLTIMAVLPVLALAACRTPNLGDNFGKANRAAMEAQEAKQAEPAGTLDGQDSKNVMNAHHSQAPAGQTSPGQQTPSGDGAGTPIILAPGK